MFRALKNYITNPMSRFCINTTLKINNLLSDEAYLKKQFKLTFGYELDLNNPQTFNEKLQWLKLYDRKPEYTTMVDKYAVKKYVADRIGDEYIIPTLGVWDSFDEIDFDSLPDQFVLKTNHDCGGLVICRDKSKLDKKAAKKKLTRSLKRNYYFSCREWPYKNVKRRIIAEQYMEDQSNLVKRKSDSLPVYKFFCFDGEPRIVQTIQNDKMPNESIDYFDINWNLLDMRQNFPNSKVPLDKPEQLEEMLDLVKELSKGKPGFLRVDLYLINTRLYFSEYTFFSDAGLAKFYPECCDRVLGSWIKLPPKAQSR